MRPRLLAMGDRSEGSGWHFDYQVPVSKQRKGAQVRIYVSASSVRVSAYAYETAFYLVSGEGETGYMVSKAASVLSSG